MIIVTSTTLLILLIVYLVGGQRLAKNGPGYSLYWLHDNVFLPIKGYTYTLAYPTSLIWWGVIAAVCTIWLSAILLERSLVRRLHLCLVRWAIGRPRLHRGLVTTARWLKRCGFQPELLRAVAERERALALVRLAMDPARAGQKERAKAIHLTRLLIQLLTLQPSSLSEHLRAAACWQQTLLQTRFYDGHQGNGLHDLTGHIEDIVRPILDGQNSDLLGAALAQPASFDPASLAVDLLCLACLYEPSIAESALGAQVATQSTQQQIEMIQGRLAESVETRRAQLDRIRAQLEMLTLYDHPATSALGAIDLVPTTSVAQADLPVMGQLSLGIALDLARWVGAPKTAWGYINAIEALAFTLRSISPPQHYIAPGLVHDLVVLFGKLPRVEDYWMCAQLAQAKLCERQGQWDQSAFSGNGLVQANDFALAGTRITSLYHAAGPGLDSTAKSRRQETQ
jgi:hypothetical protein